MESEAEAAWLAGLFDGEGCIQILPQGGTQLSVGMTDEDVIGTLQARFPSRRPIQVLRPAVEGYKTQYIWRVSQPALVRHYLILMLPWLGERRAAKALSVLRHLDTRPSARGRIGRAAKQPPNHCASGHPLTADNVVIDNRGGRKCRRCRDQRMKEWQQRHPGPGQAKGERHWKAKLTEAQVAEIRASVEPNNVLAAKYGMSRSQISRIRRRENWAA